MSAARRITHFERDAGNVSVRVLTDPAGRTETLQLPKPRIAIHLGNSVYMVCQRAVQSLSEIAHAAGVSVSHLKTTFRQFAGAPVHQYVIRRRVERAATLLAQGILSISEVAHETGFAHQSQLAKHMQRILGCSPKAVRRA